MLLYHGTTTKFEKFEYKYIGAANGTNEGFGFYLSDSKEIAQIYASPYLPEIEFSPKKSISNKTKMSLTNFKKIIKILQSKRDILSNYGDVAFEGYNKVLSEAIELEFTNQDNDVDILCSLTNGCGCVETVCRAFYKVLSVTHIIEKEADWGNNVKEGHTVYAVLIPEVLTIK